MNNSLNLKQAFSNASVQHNTTPKKQYARTFSMRLSDSERAFLDQHCGSLSWAGYIRKRVFGEKAEKRRPVKRAVPDTALLAQVLAELGASRLSANINQLAKHANMGTLDVSPETEREIETACREIHTMRMLLIAALGIQPEDGE